MTDTTGSRRDFLLAAFVFAVAMVGTTLPTPLYVFYQQTLGFGPTWLTLIFSIYAAGVIAALLVVGSWSDQLGRRPMLAAGLLMGAASAAVFLFAHSIPALLVGRLFSGFSAGIMAGTATVAVIEAAPAIWREHATLMATAANMLGLGLGPLLAGFTAQYLPWPLHLVFWLHLALLALALLAIAACRETAPRPARPRLQVQHPAIPAAVRPWFIPASIGGLAGFSVAGVFTSLVPSLVNQVMGVHNALVVGAAIALFFVASVFGQAVLKWLPAAQHMAAGCGGLCLGMLALGLAIALGLMPLLLLAAVLAGAGQGMVFRAGMAAVARATPPAQKAAVTSALFVVFYFSMSLPVIALGLSIPRFGLSHTGEVFSALVALIALLALASMKRVDAHQQAISTSR
ncbi:MFS transporter [Pseudomonas typographi]|uniref:MFS transporter n=1 Tax=Pseudomonas typographi TaxID=2715964 RepID=A0ABR7YYN2_9PSED|nr:MFS transporter [Pseudomonas typographi]MBD1550771.1 MFS transporter [Pseudomonas typographi]MBD1587713.1 MFS transporter [Pseudomonas typographi]MBD1598236.1 MFS transporter [Pseudomonas typographi]